MEEIDGKWYCKSHAAGQRRRLANDAKRQAGKQAADAANEAVQARIKAVNEALKVSAREHISDYASFKGGAGIVYSNHFALVPLDDLERLARGK